MLWFLPFSEHQLLYCQFSIDKTQDHKMREKWNPFYARFTDLLCLQDWSTYGLRSTFDAYAFKTWKSLSNRSVLSVKRFSFFSQFSILGVVYRNWGFPWNFSRSQCFDFFLTFWRNAKKAWSGSAKRMREMKAWSKLYCDFLLYIVYKVKWGIKLRWRPCMNIN